jgi:uncharacterized membrane protein
MDALATANLRILRRLDAIERRLKRLEAAGAKPAEPEPSDSLPLQPELPLQAAQPLVGPPPPAAAPAPSPSSSIDAAETAVGLNWLNRIGALTLVIGAAFFFKYAVDNAWIGPFGRILLGLLAGASVFGYGFHLCRKGHSVFAQGVSAAGLGLLYLSGWASYSLYHLAPAPLAFTAMAGVTLLGGAFAVRFGAIAVAALGMAGGYFTPVLLSSGEYRPWFFSSYLFILNAGWLYVARKRGWWKLDPYAAGFTLLLGFDFLKGLRIEHQGLVGSFCLATQYPLFAASPLAWLIYIAQAIAGIGGALAWEDNVWPAGAVLLAVLASGLAIAARRALRPLPLISWLAFTAGIFLLYENYSQPVPTGSILVVATAGFLIAFDSTAVRLFRNAEKPGRFELLMLALPGLCYFLEGYHLLSAGYPAWRGLFSAGLALTYLVAGWLLRQNRPEESRDNRPVLFCVGSALVLFTVAIAIQFSGFRITMLWALEAAALAWLSSRYETAHLRLPVALLSAFVLFRLLAIDGPAHSDPHALSMLANIRFLTCLVSACSLGCAAWLLRSHVSALAPYLCGHASLLAGLAFESRSWVMRNVAPAGQASAVAAGLDLLAAAYGLALVAAGVAARSRLNRLLGLGLLAVVVLKLYIADVWIMDRLSRILAFSALGLLLLAASFFYSRFRARLEAWIGSDPPAPSDTTSSR